MPRTPPVACQYCGSSNTVRNGFHKPTGSQKVTCKDCGRHSRTAYQHRAYCASITTRIDHYQDAGISVRQTARLIKIGAATVHRTKRKLADEYRKRIETPYPIPQNVTHVIAWSGGKDSSALVIWALQHLPTDRTRFVFCDTGWESPLTYQFIEEVNHRLLGGKLIVLKSKRYSSVLDLAEQKRRFPSTKARFCTEQLKIIPMMEWILVLRNE
ncbi:phosphoadenosine phosphosulfate reductase family protein [Candidatus Woesearchaeota archaeon]|nr:phosphoadenosine phosphosulfate reductase family protein [Candidatus Woesearchaeota archaeon]